MSLGKARELRVIVHGNYTATELQDNLNARLVSLGDANVISISLSATSEGFVAFVIYKAAKED